MINLFTKEMNYFEKFFLFFFFYVLLNFSSVESKGDLTKQNPIEMIVQLKGDSNTPYQFHPNFLKFETGKLYKLRLINSSQSKHYFSSTNFSNSIFTRKVQVNFKGKKLAEIKGSISEVEVFPSQELEGWFVPIKTGKFYDLKCSVRDDKSKKSHAQLGMIGTIIIE